MQGQKTLRMPVIAVGALVMAMALVASLGLAGFAPQQAYASGKKAVYVVTKKATTYPDGSTAITTYKYDKKGLIKSMGEKSVSDSGTYKSTVTIAYDKKNSMQKMVSKTDFGTSTTTYKPNKKGWIVKSTRKGEFGTSTTTYAYTKKGQLQKSTDSGATTTYKYDKRGNLIRLTEKSTTNTFIMKFGYDRKNNLARESAKDVIDNTYKNSYNGKRLTKQVVTDVATKDKRTITYTYKKVSAPKSLVKMINGQQVYIKCSNVDLVTAHK